MTLKKDGDITRVGADRKPHSLLDKKSKTDALGETRTYTAVMANYFSMGECARIGYSFEKRRTNSRAGNLMAYSTAWLKRFCCGCATKAQPIGKNIDYVHNMRRRPPQKGDECELPTIEEKREEDEVTM